MVFYLLRYAEIGIKGKNRAFFERLLIENVKKVDDNLKIKKTQGRLLVESDKTLDFRRVFGLSSYSIALRTDVDFFKIAEVASSLKPKLGKFRVSCQRVDKRIPIKSITVEKEVGALLFEQGGKVDLKNFDTNVCVELIEGMAYIFTDVVECFGGLPVGSQSKVAVLLQSAKDVLAGLLALKRGCFVLPICLDYADTTLLANFGANPHIHIKSLSELEDTIKNNDCLLLYSGQCLKDFFDFEFKNIPTIRPLVFYSDKEIEKEFLLFKSV